jgi:NADH-quinone oxidoreductase subunit N
VGQGGGLGSGDGVLMLGVALILVGLGFKVAAVPFHFWAPDVYTGAPTSVTAFMATAVKAGAFAMALRTIAVALEPLGEELGNLMWLAAAATMTVGNLAALRQTGLKRMLAYSSVAHSGYLLIGFCAAGHGGIAAVLFYLAVYGAMNLAAFGVLMAVGDEGDGGDDISRLAGMGHRRPMMAAAMTVAMLSLTGFPPLGGFMGKLFLFSAALEAGLVGLVLVAVANTVLSAVYYLAVVRTMYFVEPAQATAAVRHQPYLAVAVAISVAVVLALGLAPAALMDGAREALALTVLGP